MEYVLPSMWFWSFKCIEVCLMTQDPCWWMFHVLAKNVHSAIVRWNFCKCQLDSAVLWGCKFSFAFASILSSSSTSCLQSDAELPTWSCALACFSSPLCQCFMHFEILYVSAYTFGNAVSSVDRFFTFFLWIHFDINVVFCFLKVNVNMTHIFFYLFTLNLHISLCFTCISCRQHVLGSFF